MTLEELRAFGQSLVHSLRITPEQMLAMIKETGAVTPAMAEENHNRAMVDDLKQVFALAESMLMLSDMHYRLSGRITLDSRGEEITFERADDEEIDVQLSEVVLTLSDVDKPQKSIPDAIREGFERCKKAWPEWGWEERP